ncbi:MAG: glycosyltransferase family 1 protein [Chloroflexi bacterium]|nr:glycosyltransferase [Chloroflexota bacterium]MQC26830.1 glycosyltransferase family 1 protein [Chloroflexota bacterium]
MKTSLRIAMLSYHTSPLAKLGGRHSGGMNVYVRQLSASLGVLGHQVDIFTRKNQPNQPDVDTSIARNVRVIALKSGPQSELDRTQLAEHIPEFVHALAEFSNVEASKYDLVHAHYWMSGLAAAQLKPAWNVPVILMMHTLGLVKNRIADLGQTESVNRIRGERQALAAADRVVAATPAEMAELQWLYEVRRPHICVIPPGVDLDLFRPMPKNAARRALDISPEVDLVLYVGRIEPLKGLETLLRAFHQISDQTLLNQKNLRLQVIGGPGILAQSTSEMNRLMSVVAELGLQDRVFFLGSKTQIELPIHYAAADVVVVPSQYESFGLVALEAMAAGRPVLASRVGGLTHLVKDGLTGYHLEEGDYSDLAAHLSVLLEDSALQERLGANGRQTALAYSWDMVGERIADLYQSLL